MIYPKISIVTPSFNQAAYLEHTILSILEQNYPNLEYIIIDGGSTDGSVEIIKKYADRLAYWVSEKDNGLYHAIQKGFDQSTGEIMGWLNSDDMLHRNSLYSIAEILTQDGVEWLTSTGTLYDEKGRTIRAAKGRHWSKYHFLMGDYQWIQQESTYWKRSLWERAGSRMTAEYKFAGEIELWNRFFKYANLYTSDCLIGGFRIRTGNQLSLDNSGAYVEEVNQIIASNKPSSEELVVLQKIKRIDRNLKLLSRSRLLNMFFITSRLQKQREKLLDLAPSIIFNREKQQFGL